MVKMTKKEIRRFLKRGTFTGKLATVKKDGNSHVVPIWFVLNDQNSDGKLEDIYLTTGIESVKANNIKHNSRVSLSVDDQIPPFSFVVVEGEAKIFP
jgi:nitroimidazol reductase NimA-like FMN-containing flavoprotein (pyridoxamine 5'-phosphate oxidase superfamily)